MLLLCSSAFSVASSSNLSVVMVACNSLNLSNASLAVSNILSASRLGVSKVMFFNFSLTSLSAAAIAAVKVPSASFISFFSSLTFFI